MDNNLYKAGSLLLIMGMLSTQLAFSKSVRSSIQVSFVKGTPEAREEANTPRLFKLAKLSKQQAKTIALSRYKGRFGKVDLENEDGNLIWSIEIGKHELAIDAGDGKILQVE